MEFRDGRVFICSDSHAALKPVCSAKVTSPPVVECDEELDLRNKEVSLMWLSTIDIELVADELTRDGENKPCQDLEPYLGVTQKLSISALNQWIEDKVHKRCRNLVGYIQVKNRQLVSVLHGPTDDWNQQEGYQYQVLQTKNTPLHVLRVQKWKMLPSTL